MPKSSCVFSQSSPIAISIPVRASSWDLSISISSSYLYPRYLYGLISLKLNPDVSTVFIILPHASYVYSTITTPYTSTTYPPIAPPYQSTENYDLPVYSTKDTFQLTDCEDLTEHVDFIAMKLGVLQAKVAKEMLIQYGTSGLSKFVLQTEVTHVDDDITIRIEVVYKDIQSAYAFPDR